MADQKDYCPDTPQRTPVPAATAPDYEKLSASHEPLSGLLRGISQYSAFCPSDSAQSALSPLTFGWRDNFYRGD